MWPAVAKVEEESGEELLLNISPGKLGLVIKPHPMGGEEIVKILPTCLFKDLVEIGWRIISVDGVPIITLDGGDTGRNRVMKFVKGGGNNNMMMNANNNMQMGMNNMGMGMGGNMKGNQVKPQKQPPASSKSPPQPAAAATTEPRKMVCPNGPSVKLWDRRVGKRNQTLCNHVDSSGTPCQNIAQKGGRCVSHGAIARGVFYGPYDDPIGDGKITNEYLQSILSKDDFGFHEGLRRLKDKIEKQRTKQKEPDRKFNSDLASGICRLAEEQVQSFFNGNGQFSGEENISYWKDGLLKWSKLRDYLFNFFVSMIKNALMDLFIGFDYGELTPELRAQIRDFVDKNVRVRVEKSSDGRLCVFKLGTGGKNRKICNTTYPGPVFDRSTMSYLDLDENLPPHIRHLAERYAIMYATCTYVKCGNDNLPCNRIPSTPKSESECRLYIIFSRYDCVAMHESQLLITNRGERVAPTPSETIVDETPVNEEGGESHGSQDVDGAEDLNLTSAADDFDNMQYDDFNEEEEEEEEEEKDGSNRGVSPNTVSAFPDGSSTNEKRDYGGKGVLFSPIDSKRGHSNQSNADGPSPKLHQPTVSRQLLSNPPENAQDYKAMAEAYALNQQSAKEDYEGRIIGNLLDRGHVSLDELGTYEDKIKLVAKGRVKDSTFVKPNMSQDDSILIESFILGKRSGN
jgi:hypothetical protein